MTEQMIEVIEAIDSEHEPFDIFECESCQPHYGQYCCREHALAYADPLWGTEICSASGNI